MLINGLPNLFIILKIHTVFNIQYFHIITLNETLLPHLSIEYGRYGLDLAAQDKYGNTVLHDLAFSIATKPTMATSLLSVSLCLHTYNQMIYKNQCNTIIYTLYRNELHGRGAIIRNKKLGIRRIKEVPACSKSDPDVWTVRPFLHYNFTSLHVNKYIIIN